MLLSKKMFLYIIKFNHSVTHHGEALDASWLQHLNKRLTADHIHRASHVDLSQVIDCGCRGMDQISCIVELDAETLEFLLVTAAGIETVVAYVQQLFALAANNLQAFLGTRQWAREVPEYTWGSKDDYTKRDN